MEESSQLHSYGHFIFVEWAPGNHYVGGWGPQTRYGRYGEVKFSWTPAFQIVARRYTDELSWLLFRS
jgi:hypothetical protein